MLGKLTIATGIPWLLLKMPPLLISTSVSTFYLFQVSRAAYEIMQTLHADAASYAHSLDDIFYFGGQHAHSQKALYDHVAMPDSQEISFNAGDTIGVAGNHWDGYSKGINRRTNQEGLYPSYKVEEIIRKIDFSSFPEVDDMALNFTLQVK